jgi:hypothetical protein
MKNTPAWMSKVSKIAFTFSDEAWTALKNTGRPMKGGLGAGVGFQIYDASQPAVGSKPKTNALTVFCKSWDPATTSDAELETQLRIQMGVHFFSASHAHKFAELVENSTVARWCRNELVNESVSDQRMYHLSPNPELAKSLHEGALQFAGSEASSTNPGFLEGAVEAGENAAAGAIVFLKAADLEKLRKQGQKWVSINSDKSQNYLVNISDVEGSSAGNVSNVQRVIYERLGGEVARATSKVTFQPNTTFPEHAHDGGEEFVVLNGVWRDRWGAFPKYSYVRNYIGSRHSPQIGAEGVEIMVKLRQMTHAHKEPENSGVSFAPPVGVEEGVTSVDGWELVNAEELAYEDAKVFEGANFGPSAYLPWRWQRSGLDGPPHPPHSWCEWPPGASAAASEPVRSHIQPSHLLW